MAFIREAWNGWTEKDRSVARQAALDAAQRQIKIARQDVTPEGPSLLKEIECHGVAINTRTTARHASPDSSDPRGGRR